MSIEPGPSSSASPQNDFGSLQGCFVEGSPEQRKRERRIRRRALIISVAAQVAILAAIILIPLFGKPESIAHASVMPLPPYFHRSGPAHPQPPRDPGPHIVHIIEEHFFAPTNIPKRPPAPDPIGEEPEGLGFPTGPGASTPCVGCITLDDNRHQPPPPPPPPTPHRLLVAHLEPAMLIQRVEPIYPALSKQIHREGQVELRAVIATDGTIQSLQVVSGDPLFVRSATDAVSQWRYRPTVLNDQPVEIETYITVIYTLQH
jgi:periplasmic protein TonB